MMFGSSLPPVVCRRAHVLFTLFVFVCIEWCPTPIVLCFCFVFLHLVYPKLPVSLDCPFFYAPSVFSNVHIFTSSSLFPVLSLSLELISSGGASPLGLTRDLVTTVDGVVCSSCHDGRDGEEEDGVGGNCRL
jgi:hypothetical protein